MKTPLIATLLLAASLAAPLARADTPSAAPSPALSGALTAYDDGNLKAAAKGFAASAKQGEALGQFNLAMMNLRRELPGASDTKAWALLLRAAAQHLSHAENALGEMIEQGRHGTRDKAAACGWFERAAQHGNGDGALAIATCFYLGRGRPEDLAQAHHWYLEAAKSGDVGARYLVATMFEKGLGVEADARLARYWYESAAKNGDVAAKARVKAMQDADTSS